FPDDLAEISRRREMMMQTAVGDEEHVAARDFTVDDATDVDSGAPHEVAPELDHEVRLRQRILAAGHEIAEVGADRREVERRLAREVRDAEASADVEHLDRQGRRRRETYRELDRLLLRLADC